MSQALAPDGAIERYLASMARLLPGPADARADLLDELRDGLYSGAEAYRRAGYPAAEAARRSLAEFGAAAPIAAAHSAEFALRVLRRAGYGVLAMIATMIAVGVMVTPAGPPVPGGHGSPGHVLLVTGGVVAVGAVLGLLRIAAAPRVAARRVVIALAIAAAVALTGVATEVGAYTANAALFQRSALIWPWALALPLAAVIALVGVVTVGRTVRRCLVAQVR